MILEICLFDVVILQIYDICIYKYINNLKFEENMNILCKFCFVLEIYKYECKFFFFLVIDFSYLVV